MTHPHSHAPQVDPFHYSSIPSATHKGFKGKTKRQEDREMFSRYWRNVREARRNRDFEEAKEWLNLMRPLKRHINGTNKRERPEVFNRLRSAVIYLNNSSDGPCLTQKEIAEYHNGNANTISKVVSNDYVGISDQNVLEAYKAIMPQAIGMGYNTNTEGG